jgi:adenine-specific DNA-methyltransferase
MPPRAPRPTLDWPGRSPPSAPSATLTPRPDLAYTSPLTGIIDNLVIHGDNLPALAALRDGLTGAVRCIYLDPPYNTGARFEHYDDDDHHAAWLSAIADRLTIARELLHPDGLLFVQIDDREVAYLQVLLDELFGRENRVNTVVVKMSEASGLKMTHVARRLPKLKEYLLIYGKRPDVGVRPQRVVKEGPRLDRYLAYYSKVIVNPDDPPERWEVVPVRDYLRANGRSTSPDAVRAFQLDQRHRVVYRTNNRVLAKLTFPTSIARVTTASGRDYIWWEGRQMLFLADHCEGWLGDLWTDLSTINLNKEGGVDFPNGKKPEALLRRVLALATDPGDLVLDAYAGSGTTGAVAHQLGRRWIVIERGEQCLTHVLPRLRREVDAHGGGFSFAEVVTAPPVDAIP